jgi:diacylglycerol diphosphate phosphatase / phosphatidate phosphatase
MSKRQGYVLLIIYRIFLTTFVTNSIKNAVGRPRPDLIARCRPREGTPERGLVTHEVCTETDHHILQDGWRSFPSGHSSFGFAGLGYLALFFCGQLHVFRPRRDLTQALFALSPLLGATMIAISRCEDYRHDVYDVTCGSIIGISIAYFSYRRYYPLLRHPKCHEPFASKATDEEGFAKLRDDEEAQHGVEDFALGDFDEDRTLGV